MISSTAEFPALSERDIERPRSLSGKRKAQKQLITPDLRPLPFQLNFSNGECLRVTLMGSGNEPSVLWRIVDRLKELAELRKGWNSYNAEPLNPRAVRRALQLLPALSLFDPADPAVIPANDGGVQLEWHAMTGDVEIHVPPSGPIEYLVSDAETDTDREWQGAFDVSALAEAFVKMNQQNV